MYKKTIRYLSFLFLLLPLSCGFEVVNKSKINNFTIKEIRTDGDKRISYRIKNNTDILKKENFKEFKKFDQDPNTSSNYDESINLKEKWSLILSKLELPSTRMLLSQQAELLNIGKTSIEIGLSPNWENMIKSRRLIIENAVKKIFGEHMKINFSSKQNISSNIQKNNSQINNDIKINSRPNDDSKEKTIPKEQNFNNNTKNLADFFNGEIVDIND